MTGGRILLAGAALVVTLIGAIVFFPRLSVSSDATLNPTDPLATPFILHNDGYFTVHSEEIICTVMEAEAASLYEAMFGIGLTSADLRKEKEIRPDKSIEFTCPEAVRFSGPITKMRIEIYVGFDARGFPESRTKECFRFVTRPDNDNKLRWFAAPTSEERCEKPGPIVVKPEGPSS